MVNFGVFLALVVHPGMQRRRLADVFARLLASSRGVVFRSLDNLHSDETAIVLSTTSRPRNIKRLFFFFNRKKNFFLCKWLP